MLRVILGFILVISAIALMAPGIVASSPAVEADQLNPALGSAQSLIGAAAVRKCDDYYFRSDLVNVGADGN